MSSTIFENGSTHSSKERAFKSKFHLAFSRFRAVEQLNFPLFTFRNATHFSLHEASGPKCDPCSYRCHGLHELQTSWPSPVMSASQILSELNNLKSLHKISTSIVEHGVVLDNTCACTSTLISARLKQEAATTWSAHCFTLKAHLDFMCLETGFGGFVSWIARRAVE